MNECVVCQGELVSKNKTVFDPFLGPPIYGPGSKEQYYVVQDGWTCPQCGLHYDKLPNTIKKSTEE